MDYYIVAHVLILIEFNASKAICDLSHASSLGCQTTVEQALELSSRISKSPRRSAEPSQVVQLTSQRWQWVKESKGENSSTKTKEKEKKESVVFAYPRHTEQKLYFYTENKRKALDL